MDISVIVLAYNEGRRIEPCLQSARWARELLVIDGFSTDETVAIARRYADRVIQSGRLGPENAGGFADQRNFAMEQTNAEWVFFLDADERFAPELAREIQRRLGEGIPVDIDALQVRRKEHFFGVHTPYTHGEAWQRRMLRREACRWDGRLVHEEPRFKESSATLDGYLLHFSKDSLSAYVGTMNSYTTLEARQARREGRPLSRSPLAGMLKTFLNLYFYKGSYREGAFGFIMSILFSFYHFLSWAKQWEIALKEGHIQPAEPLPRGQTVSAMLHRLWRGCRPPACHETE